MACFDRINIPQSLLPADHSSIQRLKALGTLIGYAFITEQQQAQGVQSERLFDMHRLVHIASALWLDGHKERVTWAKKAADRVLDLVPSDGHEGKEVWTTYLPHAIYVAGLGGIVEDTLRAAVLTRVGKCQATLGQYRTAETTHRQAQSLRANELGEGGELTLQSLNEVGNALIGQASYAEAETIHREVIAGREKLPDIDPLWALSSMCNLANVLRYLGKHDQAESMYRKIIAQATEALGADSTLVLTCMGNLALILKDRGKREEAELLYRRALAGQEKLYGRGHSQTLVVMSNLAAVLSSRGKHEEAVSLTEEVFERRIEALGPDHPDSLISLNNLISLSNSDEESEPMLQDLLERRQKVLGYEHPLTLDTMHNLALCLDKLGRSEAEAVGRKALALREKVFGYNHSETLFDVWALAFILGHGFDFEESRILYERAYPALCASRGENDPNTRRCRRDWDEMLAVQEQSRSVTEKLASRVSKIKIGKWGPFGE
jgi:tetratricopeptide (TPR) repeat protein